jgi:PAS domain S-box-containing protein
MKDSSRTNQELVEEISVLKRRIKELEHLETNITDRKQADATRRDSEARFRVLAESSTSSIFIIQEEKYVYINPAFTDMTGYTFEDLSTMRFWDFISPDMRELVRDRGLARQRGEKIPSRYDLKFVTKSGEERVGDFSASPVEFNGRPAMLGSVVDITERKKMEEALRRSESKYRAIFENAIEGIFQSTPEGRYLNANPALARMYGYESPEDLMESVTDIGRQIYVNPEDRDRFRKRIEERGFIEGNETAHYRKDGSTFWVSSNARAVHDSAGLLLYYEGADEEITERKRAEEQLRLSEEKYRNIFENAIEGMYQSSPEGRFLSVNPAFARMLGYSSPEALVDSVTDIGTQYYIDPEHRRRFLQILERDGVAEKFETRVRRKDGTDIWISNNARVVKDSEGRILYYEGAIEDITERRQAEEALKKSEALLRSIVSASPVGISLDTAERVIVWANDALASISGYTLKELEGRSARIFYASDEVFARAGEIIHNEVRDGRIAVTETTFLHKDGQIRDVQLTAAPVDAKDASAGIVFVVVNITERKLAEEELQKAHQHLFNIIDFLPDATFVIDREKRVVAWNRAIEEMTGVKKEEILGKGDYAYAVPFYGEPRPIVIDLVFERNELMEKTYDHVQRVGNRLFVEVYVPKIYRGRGAYISATASPLFDREGNVVGAIETIRDTTEQKRIEKALQESEERYRTAIESSNDGIVMVKGEKHLYVNRKFLAIFGFDSPHEVIGKSVGLVVHPHDKERVAGINRARQMSEEAPSQYEFKGIRRNGDIVFIEVSATKTTYQGDTIALVFLRDISERKSLEAQLLQAQKMEAIGTLAGGVAHDFNNILMALMGYGNLLQMKMDRNDPLRVYVDQILSSTGKAANITQSLLAFGRKQVMEMKPYTITTIVKDVEKLLQRLMPEDIEFTIKLGDDTTVMADMTQIDQVLINLATNARDAMPKGGKLTIETGRVMIDEEFRKIHNYGEPGSYALLSVSDTGIGMDEKTQGKIFEPFFTTKEVGKGTGLGLSIVYGIIKQHNGYIKVSSRPGEGTTFLVYLPEVKETPQATRTAVREAKGGSETLLLAEDNADIRAITSEILKRSGYTVIEAVNGQDAVEKFREHRDEIGLIILDVVMPEKNGKEAYEEIRTMRHDIKALFMSGYTGDVVLDRGVSGKALDYVAKPIAPNELLHKVRNILDR